MSQYRVRVAASGYCEFPVEGPEITDALQQGERELARLLREGILQCNWRVEKVERTEGAA